MEVCSEACEVGKVFIWIYLTFPFIIAAGMAFSLHSEIRQYKQSRKPPGFKKG